MKFRLYKTLFAKTKLKQLQHDSVSDSRYRGLALFCDILNLKIKDSLKYWGKYDLLFAGTGARLDFIGTVNLVKSNKLIFALSFVSSLFFASYINASTTPMYKSVAQVFV